MTGAALEYVVLLAVSLLALLFGGAMLRARHRRGVCPETGLQVELDCDQLQAARAAFGDGQQKVVGCARWPERADCDRACERELRPLV